MASIADYNRKALDRSLNPALDFMASHPVYRDIGVKSGRRSKASNRKAGGAKKSQHLQGKALDLDVSRLSNAQKAQLLSDLASYGIKGIGIYDNNNIHIDARKDFATWGPNPKDKYAGVDISQQPKWARQALTAIQQAGPYKAFPAAPAAVPGTASLAIGPAGTSLAEAYQKAQYQRAMPSGPTPPATAPVPTSRPLDSIGGLGALAAKGSRVAPSSLTAPAGERFGYPASPASLDRNQSMAPAIMDNAYGQWAKPMAAATLNDMMTGRNMPVGRAPAAGAALSPPHPGMTSGAQRAARLEATKRNAPSYGQTALPATAPVPAVSRTMPAMPSASNEQIARDVNAGIAQDRMVSQVGPSQRFAPAQPSTLAPTDMVKAATMQAMPNSPPIGAVGAPLGPANAPPAALAAARNLGTATAAQQIAPPAAMDAARKLGNAIAAQQIATPAILAEKVSQPAQTAQQQPAQNVQQAQNTQQRGIQEGLAGPWGASIASQRPGQPGPYGFAGQQPTLDRMTTQSTQQPTTFGQKLGNFAQRSLPAIAGTMIGGPVGGLIGMGLGRMFDAAKPGQVFGNPFQGLANTAKAMGMFQSQTPYAGPISNYGTGLKAISGVLGGGAPVGARAYSRSTPGYSVTAVPGGIQRTNQYGFTSFERSPTGPTGASFSSFADAGSRLGGGIFGGGSGQSSGKTSGGRTSGGKSSSSKSSGGRKSERAESAGYR